jgi:hypothetical protein
LGRGLGSARQQAARVHQWVQAGKHTAPPPAPQVGPDGQHPKLRRVQEPEGAQEERRRQALAPHGCAGEARGRREKEAPAPPCCPSPHPTSPPPLPLPPHPPDLHPPDPPLPACPPPRAPTPGITKLSDANDAGTRNSGECTLILTEGDSAKSLAMSGLSVVGHDKWGVFPLRCGGGGLGGGGGGTLCAPPPAVGDHTRTRRAPPRTCPASCLLCPDHCAAPSSRPPGASCSTCVTRRRARSARTWRSSTSSRWGEVSGGAPGGRGAQEGLFSCAPAARSQV